MMPKSARIIFIGTPDFSIPSLAALVKSDFKVVAVITAPDRRAGRGMKLTMSPVKKFALEHQIPVLQPTNLKNADFLDELKSFNADVQVVIAFRMLPEAVWNMPKLGTINLHASLLPDYRGAAPINRAIMAGEKKTGLTTFKLKHSIDTGNILLQKEIDILSNDTAGSLHDKMMNLGGDLVMETLIGVVSETIHEKEQQFGDLDKQAPKIFKNDCEINWALKCDQIKNHVRGLSPYPTAWFMLHDKVVKVYEVQANISDDKKVVGEISSDNKSYLKISCADGYIFLQDLQLEGKKRLNIEEFLRGYSI